MERKICTSKRYELVTAPLREYLRLVFNVSCVGDIKNWSLLLRLTLKVLPNCKFARACIVESFDFELEIPPSKLSLIESIEYCYLREHFLPSSYEPDSLDHRTEVLKYRLLNNNCNLIINTASAFWRRRNGANTVFLIQFLSTADRSL